MKKDIQLLALDMDGTLFNQNSRISTHDQQAIRRITDRGTEVAISTGRPYIGLPKELLLDIGIRYAITTNGAAIYRLLDDACIYANYMQPEKICPLIETLQTKDIHMDAFIDGNCYCLASCEPKIDLLCMPASIRAYIRSTRTFVTDLAAYIKEHHLSVQKMTLNFYQQADGTFLERSNVIQILSSNPDITFLSGGYHNLEFTKKGTSKGMGLKWLCHYLGLSVTQTMACGDTENDIDILKTAAIGVAMGNATEEVKQIADFITLTNEESGVAYAIERYFS